MLAPIAVDAVLGIIDPNTATNVDLSDVKIVKQVGGTMDDTELVRGLVLEHGAKKSSGGPTKIENAKIALIQFCLSAPKTDMENNVVGIYSLTHSLTHSLTLTHSPTHSLTYLLTHSLTHLFTHSPIHSPTHLLPTHSLTYSLAHSF